MFHYFCRTLYKQTAEGVWSVKSFTMCDGPKFLSKI